MTATPDRHDGATAATTPRRLIVISAGTGEPSSTRMLTDRIAQNTLELLRDTDTPAVAGVIELAPLAVDIASATVAGFPSEQLQAAIDQIASADAIIAATPVYKAGISGLFKSFIDVLDDDLLIAKPVLLAATAGSSRHALVVDEQMRPLFAYMRALTMPTSVFAGPEDWGATELGDREAVAGDWLMAHGCSFRDKLIGWRGSGLRRADGSGIASWSAVSSARRCPCASW